MKLSEKQCLVMLSVLREALECVDGAFGYKQSSLRDLYNEIINQQSTELKDIGTDEADK